MAAGARRQASVGGEPGRPAVSEGVMKPCPGRPALTACPLAVKGRATSPEARSGCNGPAPLHEPDLSPAEAIGS